ncbi:MAG: hypothetical protein R6W67_03730, partial [Bacteroidales bacterium]
DGLIDEYVFAKSFASESSRFLFYLAAVSGSGTVKYCLIDKVAGKGFLFNTLANDLSGDLGFFVGSCDDNFYYSVSDYSYDAVYNLQNSLLVLHLKK